MTESNLQINRSWSQCCLRSDSSGFLAACAGSRAIYSRMMLQALVFLAGDASDAVQWCPLFRWYCFQVLAFFVQLLTHMLSAPTVLLIPEGVFPLKCKGFRLKWDAPLEGCAASDRACSFLCGTLVCRRLG